MTMVIVDYWLTLLVPLYSVKLYLDSLSLDNTKPGTHEGKEMNNVVLCNFRLCLDTPNQKLTVLIRHDTIV
jgi:hypothetical protein